MRGKQVLRFGGWILMGVAGAGLLGLILGIAVQLLWNWLMPSLFGLPAIGYWQAVGLFLLSHLLFKGGHHGTGRGDREHARFADRVRRLVPEHGRPTSGTPDGTEQP